MKNLQNQSSLVKKQNLNSFYKAHMHVDVNTLIFKRK